MQQIVRIGAPVSDERFLSRMFPANRYAKRPETSVWRRTLGLQVMGQWFEEEEVLGLMEAVVLHYKNTTRVKGSLSIIGMLYSWSGNMHA